MGDKTKEEVKNIDLVLFGDKLPLAVLKFFDTQVTGNVPVQECNSRMALDAQVSCQKGQESINL